MRWALRVGAAAGQLTARSVFCGTAGGAVKHGVAEFDYGTAMAAESAGEQFVCAHPFRQRQDRIGQVVFRHENNL